MFYNLVVILTWSWEEVSTALTYSVILTGTPGVFVLCWFSLGLTALLEPDQVSFRALFTPLSALLPHCLGKLWISSSQTPVLLLFSHELLDFIGTFLCLDWAQKPASQTES